MDNIEADIFGLWEGCPCDHCMFLRKLQSKWRRNLLDWIKEGTHDELGR